MRNVFLSMLFALTAIGASAQQHIVIYDGGKEVFSQHLWEFDSIVFVTDSLPDYNPLPKTSAVDMNLTVKWAPQNIGAAAIYDKGVLFGWGETTGLTCSKKLKYYPFEGVRQGLNGTGYDMAKARWGSCWELPRLSDLMELKDNCSWEFVGVDDTDSLKAFRASNGDGVVYFPVTGYRDGVDFVEDDVPISLLWSGDICLNHDKAYALQMRYNAERDSVEVSIVEEIRSLGLAARPIYRPAGITLVGTPYAACNSATFNIVVTGDAEDVSGYGLEYALSAENLTDGENVLKCPAEVEKGLKATLNIKNLEDSTTYYFRLYLENAGETLYSDIQSITTTRNHHLADYVDLGLPSGLLWATMNLGAKTTSEYGNYFAWGETSTKDYFSKDNYVMVNEDGEKVDSCMTENGIKVKDPLTGEYRLANYLESISGTQYDAARTVWDEVWRIPTKGEFQELLDNCKWEWVTENGITGARATSKRNGRTIFFPAGGQMNRNSLSFSGRYGYYWTANIYDNQFSSEYGDTAYPFSISDGRQVFPLGLARHLGLSIRPVRNK